MREEPMAGEPRTALEAVYDAALNVIENNYAPDPDLDYDMARWRLLVDAVNVVREAEADASASSAGLDGLRAAAQRLSDAISIRAASVGMGWKAEMDADAEHLAAVKALRAALATSTEEPRA
jgi:hypothetical protein